MIMREADYPKPSLTVYDLDGGSDGSTLVSVKAVGVEIGLRQRAHSCGRHGSCFERSDDAEVESRSVAVLS